MPHAYLVEVFTCGSHLLPGFVQQLDADAEEFLEGAIVREEHGMEVVAVFTGCGKRKERLVIMLLFSVKRLLLRLRIADPPGTDADFHPPSIQVGRRWLKDPPVRSIYFLLFSLLNASPHLTAFNFPIIELRAGPHA